MVILSACRCNWQDTEKAVDLLEWEECIWGGCVFKTSSEATFQHEVFMGCTIQASLQDTIQSAGKQRWLVSSTRFLFQLCPNFVMYLFQLQFVSSEIQSIFAWMWEQLWLQICPFTFLPWVRVVCFYSGWQSEVRCMVKNSPKTSFERCNG